MSSATANPSLSSPAVSHSSFPSYYSLSRRQFSLSFTPSFSSKNFSGGLKLVSLCCQSPNFNSTSTVSAMSNSSPSPLSAIDFLTLCHRLKTTKRKGWINHRIKGPESIADHMYRMALMGLIAGDIPGVNRERCIKMAVVHDIAEAIVGDITPSDGIPKEEKSRMEQEALNEMCEVLGGGMRADEIKELWTEYENNSSLEANLVKDFDKVEMILQALEYETGIHTLTHLQKAFKRGYAVRLSVDIYDHEHGMVLDEFFLSTAGKFQTELGKSWAAEVISRRKSTLASKGK